MLIEIQEVLDALEEERELLVQREQFGAEHILVHHAIRIIEELKEQKEKVKVEDNDVTIYKAGRHPSISYSD